MEDNYIYLRFQTTNNLVSALIRFLTWSEFSHVDFYFQDGYLGAQIDGVKRRPFDYADSSQVQFARVKCPTEKIAYLVEHYAIDQIGKPYDFGAILGILFHRDWQTRRSWFCSELVAAAFQNAGYPLIDKSVNRVTPEDLLTSERVELIHRIGE